MRNFKRKFKKEYHEHQLSEIKDRAGIKPSIQEERPRTKFLIPSIVSLAFSVLILVFVISIANPKENMNPESGVDVPNGEGLPMEPAQNNAIKELEENTSKYIAWPIQSIFDAETGTIISIYYGIIKDDDNNDKHYVVIDYTTNEVIEINTIIYDMSVSEDSSEGEMGAIYDESLSIDSEELVNVQPNENTMIIHVNIGKNSHQYSIDLEEYYEYLVNN